MFSTANLLTGLGMFLGVIRPKTFTERLEAIGYPLLDVPDEFCCVGSHELMNVPIKLDHDKDHDHYVDQTWLHKYWSKDNGKNDRINPFTNLPVRLEPVIDRVCEQKIEAFVTAQEQLVARTAAQIERIKIQTNYDTDPHSNFDALRTIHFPLKQIPARFIDKNVSGNIMTYPVTLDNNDEHVVDLRALLSWWNEHTENKNKNPFTGKLLENAELNMTLFNDIKNFVACSEKEAYKPSADEDIDVQVALIKLHIMEYKQTKSNHQRLLDAQFKYEKMTVGMRNAFIAQNFIAEIITHPVKLDDKYIVDFEVLLDWWNQQPENLHKNFYTGQKIKSVEYMASLKHRIDAFASNPQESMRIRQVFNVMPMAAIPAGIYTRGSCFYPLPHRLPLSPLARIITDDAEISHNGEGPSSISEMRI